MKDGSEYTPASIVRSVATQLAVELKRIYHHGTFELQEQVISILNAPFNDLNIFGMN